jgi:signal transduction histidine kinase
MASQVERLDPVAVEVDEARMIPVVLNLLDNALSYTDPGGAIAITPQSRDGQAILTVADSGIGISSADLPHVFERFYRADRARSRETGGSGLGLAIVEWVVRALGGTMSVSSRRGRGTAFTVTLPAASAVLSPTRSLPLAGHFMAPAINPPSRPLDGYTDGYAEEPTVVRPPPGFGGGASE